jgi:ribosome maturation factor RimP
VEELARPIATRNGLVIVEVVYVSEGGRWCLRVFVDKSGGVNLSDCEVVSREIEQVLDESDFIPHFYVLEVSSPGLERPLKQVEDYVRFAGRLVYISTYVPQDGRKKFTGRLVGSSEEGVTLRVDEREVTILWNNISKARLAVEF